LHPEFVGGAVLSSQLSVLSSQRLDWQMDKSILAPSAEARVPKSNA